MDAVRLALLLLCGALYASGQGLKRLAVTDTLTIPGQHYQRGGMAVRVPVKCTPGGELFE